MIFEPGHIINHALHGIGVVQKTDWQNTSVAFCAAEDQSFSTRELRKSALVIDGPALVESHCPPDWDAPAEERAEWKPPVKLGWGLVNSLASICHELILNSVGVFPRFKYSPLHTGCSCFSCRMPLFAPEGGRCHHFSQESIDRCALCNAERASWRIAAAQLEDKKRARIEKQNQKIEREMRGLTNRTPMRVEPETMARYGKMTAEVKTKEKRAGVGVLPISKEDLKKIRNIIRVSDLDRAAFVRSTYKLSAQQRDHAIFAKQLRTFRSIFLDSQGKTLAWASAFTVEPDRLLYKGEVLNVPEYRKSDTFSRIETKVTGGLFRIFHDYRKFYQTDFSYTFDQSEHDGVRFQPYMFTLSDGSGKAISARIKNTTTDAAQYRKPQKGLPYIVDGKEPGRLTLAWNPFEEVAWLRMGIERKRSVFHQAVQMWPWVLDIVPEYTPVKENFPEEATEHAQCEHSFAPARAYCSVCNPWILCRKHFRKLKPKFGGKARLRIATDAVGKYTVKVSVISLRERDETIREVIPYLERVSDFCPHCKFGRLPSLAEIIEWEKKAETGLQAPKIKYAEDETIPEVSDYARQVAALELALYQQESGHTSQIKSTDERTGNRNYPANSEWREIAYHWIPKLYPDTNTNGSAALRLISYIYELDVKNTPATEIQLFEKISKNVQPDSITREVNRFKERVARAKAMFPNTDPPAWSTPEQAAQVTGTTAEHVLDLLNKGRLVGTRTDTGWKLSLMQVLRLAEKVAPPVQFVNNVSALECDVSGVHQ